MAETNTVTESRRPRIRWRWVALRVVPVLLLCVLIVLFFVGLPWLAQLPQPLSLRLTEWFLRGLLIGYAGSLLLALSGLFGLAWYVLRARRRGLRRPLAGRLWLACASLLISLVGVEVASAAWLAWSHRMPVLPTQFSRASAPNETSIVVIGGSSPRGYPFHPWLSVGQIVAWQLERAMPSRRFTADVRAELGATLEEMHLGLTQLERRPDAIIIYSGHNEIQARYEHSRGVLLREAPLDPILDRIYRLSLASPLCRLIYETVSKERMQGRPSRVNIHHLIDTPAMTPSEYAALVTDFHARLEAIVTYCEQIGAEPILIIPPSNEGGFEPNRSILADTATDAECARVTRAFESARRAESDDPGRALAAYRAILADHPEFAEAHFRAARLLEQGGDYASANRHYIAARDCDGYPVRCPAPFQEAYRSVARRHGCILVDGPAVLRRISPHGIVEDHAIGDAHHPTLAGHVALAQAVLEALRSRRALGWGEGPVPRVEPADAAEHFGIDNQKWAEACGISASAYRAYALIRYDPTEREAKDRRLLEAARRINEGVPPEETGVPGIGVRRREDH